MESASQTWRAGEPSSPELHVAADRLGELEQLDAVAKPVAKKIRDLIPDGAVKDTLSGTWLGHALHPLLTDLPIGTWTSATALDLVGGEDAEPAAERLVGLGLLASLPTLWTGWSDWADTEPASDSVRRIGLVHAGANGTALLLYGMSYRARRRGRPGRGKLLGLAGAGVLAFGGHLGGHLSYSKGVGVDNTAFEDEPTDWTKTLADDDVAEGEPVKAQVGPAEVVLVRREGRVYALSNRCNHRSGPLDEGELEDDCIVCPLHRSAFRLEDGSVERGPATAPQPAYDVRVREGRIEVRLRESTLS